MSMSFGKDPGFWPTNWPAGLRFSQFAKTSLAN
jgi:hypothetical protein